jgi:hypothetical protein
MSVQASPSPKIVLLDSVTQAAPEHAGCVVVTGSHAGRSVVKYAAAVPAKLYVFNDAGVGKDGAGIAALAELEALGIAAVAVAHTSARIGEALDTWQHGVISSVNAPAAKLGLAPGRRLREAVAAL